MRSYLPSNLAACWLLDEPTNTTRLELLKPSKNQLIVTGGVAQVAGPNAAISLASYLDGTNQVLSDVSPNLSGLFLNNSFGVSVLFKLGVAPINNRSFLSVIGNHVNLPSITFRCRIITGQGVFLTLQVVTAAPLGFTGEVLYFQKGNLSDGMWHLLTCSFDGETCSINVDSTGRLPMFVPGLSLINPPQAIYAGPPNGTGAQQVSLANLCVWNRVLTAGDEQLLWNGGAFLPLPLS